MATDNLVNRNRARIPSAELPKLVQLFIGAPFTLNHNYYQVEQQFGRVTGGRTQQAPAPADLNDLDQAVVVTEGYHQLLLTAAIPANHPYLTDIDWHRKKEVSITFFYQKAVYPGCECGHDLSHLKCPNLTWEMSYVERHDVSSAVEISFVLYPGVEQARVPTPVSPTPTAPFSSERFILRKLQ